MSNLERVPSDFRKTFIRHVKMLRFVGLDIFYDSKSSFFVKYFRFSMFNVLYVPMVAGQVLYLALGRRAGASFLDVATAVPTTLMALQDAVKMIVIFCRRDKIRDVIAGIAETWPTRMHAGGKEKTFRKWIRRLKFIDNSLFIFAVASLALFEVAPLAVTLHSGADQYRYPLQSYFTHRLDSHWQYALGYFYLFATSITTHMVLYISADLLLVSLTINLSMLMDLLQLELEEACGREGEGEGEGVRPLQDVVTKHQRLLWLADELSNIFGLHVFVQVSFSSVIICCFGFLTVIAEGILLNNMFAAVGVMSAIWMLCWPGQLLLDTSLGISEAAYRSEWYNKGAEVRKYIVIIMSRAQRPSYLTALGFSNLTLANFSKILSTSWSYLSLLHQMYQDTAE